MALLLAHVTTWGPLPPMTVTATGVGAGTLDLEDRPNVVRLVVGEPAAAGPPGTCSLLETNVDDLDPRVWPRVLDQLLAAGAADAWLTPVLMKKGRPAHTLHVLVAADRRRRRPRRSSSPRPPRWGCASSRSPAPRSRARSSRSTSPGTPSR